MYVLSWRTVSALTRELLWYLFPSLLRNSGNKHQNNPLVSAETVRHSSAYIILYVRLLRKSVSVYVSMVHTITNFCLFEMNCYIIQNVQNKTRKTMAFGFEFTIIVMKKTPKCVFINPKKLSLKRSKIQGKYHISDKTSHILLYWKVAISVVLHYLCRIKHEKLWPLGLNLRL